MMQTCMWFGFYKLMLMFYKYEFVTYDDVFWVIKRLSSAYAHYPIEWMLPNEE